MPAAQNLTHSRRSSSRGPSAAPRQLWRHVLEVPSFSKLEQQDDQDHAAGVSLRGRMLREEVATDRHQSDILKRQKSQVLKGKIHAEHNDTCNSCKAEAGKSQV